MKLYQAQVTLIHQQEHTAADYGWARQIPTFLIPASSVDEASAKVLDMYQLPGAKFSVNGTIVLAYEQDGSEFIGDEYTVI